MQSIAFARSIVPQPAPGRNRNQTLRGKWVAAASTSLPMVCPFAIGKAFDLAAAIRRPGVGSSRIRHTEPDVDEVVVGN
jgi:hypothetical protein